MSKSRIAKGMLIAPIPPAIFFGIVLTFVGGTNDLNFGQLLFVVCMWFVHAILFSYIIVLAIGIPGYLVMKKLNVQGAIAYAATGTILGILPLLLVASFEYKDVFGMESWVYTISTISGLLAASTFWLIAVRGSNKSLKDAP